MFFVEAHYRAGANAQSDSEYETDEENWKAWDAWRTESGWPRAMKVARSDQHVASSNIFEHFCTVLLKSAPWTMDVKHEGFPWIFQKRIFPFANFQLVYIVFRMEKKHIRFNKKIAFVVQGMRGAATKTEGAWFLIDQWWLQNFGKTPGETGRRICWFCHGIGANGSSNRLSFDFHIEKRPFFKGRPHWIGIKNNMTPKLWQVGSY